MTDSPFRGVIPPVVIPLTEKRQLDLEALERTSLTAQVLKAPSTA